MRAAELLSAIARNRKLFWEIIEALERESCCVIDVQQLEALLDAHYDGREQLTNSEAEVLLMAVSKPIPPSLMRSKPSRQ